MTCQEFEELSGAYALGATTSEENAAAETHLAHCSSCSHLRREFQAVVDLLPLTVPDVAPSPQLKGRIISAIQADAAKKPDPQKPLLQLPSIEHVQEPIPLQARTSSRSRQQRWQLQLATIAAAVFLLLFGGMLLWNLSLQGQTLALQQQVNSIAAKNNNLSPITYAIRGTGAAGNTNGQIIYYPQQNITVLVVHGLPKTTGNQVYQGWLIQNNQPKSIGLFNLQDDTATLNFEGDVRGYALTAISLESGPHATPNKPAGKIVAEGQLTSKQ